MTYLTDIETAANPAPIAQSNFEILDGIIGLTGQDTDTLLLNGATKPASLVGGIAWKLGTAPSADVADQVSLWVGDRTAGQAGLQLRSESGVLSHFGDRVGLGTLSPLGKLHTVVSGANSLLIEDSSTTANSRIACIRKTGLQLHLGLLSDDGSTFTEHVKIGGAGKILIGNQTPSNDPTTAGFPFYLYDISTVASGTYIGSNYIIESNPASASSASARGLSFVCQTTLGNAQNHTGNVLGLIGASNHQGTGTVALMQAATFTAGKLSTGPVTEMSALRLNVANTNASGSVTTGRALYIPAFTVTGTITNRWAILQEGASDHNSFSGNVLIGSTTLPSSLAKGMVFATGTAATGTVAAGQAALWFDGSNLKLRIGTTDYTLTKT